VQKGVFITFEGIDCSGKSTQASILATRIEASGRPVVMTREPGGTRIGETLRSIIKDPPETLSRRADVFLFEACRCQIVDLVIRPALEDGMVVICDRFIDSTIAYQGFGKGIDSGLLAKMNMFAVDGLVPDLSIFIDVPVETCASRMVSRPGTPKDQYERAGCEFQEKVRHGFISVASAHDRFMTVDGIGMPDDIGDKIWLRVSDVLNRLLPLSSVC